MSYQSDVLNALQGIFTSFLSRKTPVKQLWEIPLDIAGNLGQLDAHALLLYGLMWDVTSCGIAQRRSGFPSWSWSGWIGPVQWLIVGGLKYDRFQVSVLEGNGTLIPLTDHLIELIAQDISNETSIYTYNLCVEPEIHPVGFRDMWEHFETRDWDKNGFQTSYAVVGRPRLDYDVHYWLLHHTVAVEDGDELHQALCQDIFQCITMTTEHGIIVREMNGVHERIGLLDLRGRTKGEVDFPGGPLPDLHLSDPRYLRSVYPSTVRKIIIG